MDSSSQSGALFRQKIALLIDFDNMILGIEDPGFDIEIVVNALRERGVMVLGRAYGDWYRHSRHRRRLMEQGIDLIETPVFGPIIKNSADMHMALDAFEIAHTQSHIDTFCIVSGDSDFLPLIKRLQTRDKNVIVIAGQKFTSDLVRRNCSEYISYENLLAEAMNAHEDVTVIEGAYQLLARAIDTLHERGVDVRSSALKQMMVQLNPMFSERTFGCSQFRHFLDRAARASVVRLEGRDAHSGELLVSLVEEYAEARSQQRVEPRDYRSDSRSYREPSDRRSEGRLEPRERFDRFDRYEPGERRSDSRTQRDDRRSSRAEPLRSEPVRSEAPRAESYVQPRTEARTEFVPTAEPDAVAEDATLEVAAAEGTPETAESTSEAREGRRRRGGRGRGKGEARESDEPTAEPGADVEEAQADFAAGVEASQDAAQHEAEPQVLEGTQDAAQSTPSEPEFIDRNSQLGRVPLRRGRLRFSARQGVTTNEVPAPEAQAAEPTLESVAELPSDAAETPEAALQTSEAVAESAESVVEPPEAVAETSGDVTETLSSTAQLPEEASPEAEAATPEEEAKPKKRAPRRRSPRKKADAEASAAPEAAAPEASAPEAAPTEAAPIPEAVAEPAAQAPVEEPPAAETPAAEAPAEPVAAEAAPAEEAPAKPKRAPRRRSPRKKADAEAPAAPEAAPSE